MSNTNESTVAAPTAALTPEAPTTLAPAKQQSKTLVPVAIGDDGIIQLRSLDEAYRFAQYIAASGFAPKGLEKPESILIAMQHGAELGLPKLMSLQVIAVINGRPGIYGDAALALVRNRDVMEPGSFKEEYFGEPGKDGFGCRVTVQRKGEAPASEEFTVADAKTANLWGKQGPWSQYPRRMLKFRARGFLLRDQFGDVLKGLRTVEELHDMPAEKNVTPSQGLAAAVGAEAAKQEAA